MTTEHTFPENTPGNETEVGEWHALEAALLEGIYSPHREYGDHVLDEVRKAGRWSQSPAGT